MSGKEHLLNVQSLLILISSFTPVGLNFINLYLILTTYETKKLEKDSRR